MPEGWLPAAGGAAAAVDFVGDKLAKDVFDFTGDMLGQALAVGVMFSGSRRAASVSPGPRVTFTASASCPDRRDRRAEEIPTAILIFVD